MTGQTPRPDDSPRSRRAVLATIGAVALAGCGSSDTNSPTPSTPTASPSETSSPTSSPFPVTHQQTVTIERRSYHHFAFEIPSSGFIEFTVTDPNGTDFDVYLFEDGYNTGWDVYQDYQDGNKDANHDGMKGYSDENADGKAESGPIDIDPGEYHFVVDHTDYGGLDGADVDSDTPPLEATIDLTVEKI